MLRSRHTVPLIVIAIIIGGITAATALLIDWLPDQAAEQAPRVDNLLWFLMIACGVIFTLVMTFLVYSVLRFRVDDDDDQDGPPNHGHTGLEITWTVVPAILLAVVAVWAYIVLDRNEELEADRLVVDVTAEQFAWSFNYNDLPTPVASGDLRIPVGRQVELLMQSKDVIHDLYVPEFRVKQDIVPGITTRLVVNPDRVGTYQVICAELCGVGHSVMRTRVIVMPAAEYEQWTRDAQEEVTAQASESAPAAAPAGESTGESNESASETG